MCLCPSAGDARVWVRGGRRSGIPSRRRPIRSPTDYEGMITDTHCGAKHDPSIARSATDCVRACVHGGAQFALVFGDRTYILRGDPAVFKRLAGERARVAGTLNGNTITVSSAASEE